MSNNKSLSFRCIDFQTSTYKDNDFFIRMYGIDENRNTYCVHVNHFKPFFYIKVGNDWDEGDMDRFIAHLKKTSKQSNFALYKTLCEDIDSVELISRKTLYHFDNHQQHAFLYFKCHNMNPFYKIKPLYYDREKQKLFPQGYIFDNTKTELYETMIPPMLRFFHIQNISPSGWVSIETYTNLPTKQRNANTNYEVSTHFENIKSDEQKETIVPYKICSFDIEASSSHGDFPTAKKDYKKVAYDTIEYMEKNQDAIQEYDYETILKQFLLCVFQFGNDLNVDHCFVKNKEYSVKMFNLQFLKLLKYKVDLCDEQIKYIEHSMDSYFQTKEEEGDEVLDTTHEMIDEAEGYSKPKPSSKKTKETIVSLIDVLKDESYDAKIKTSYLLQGLNKHLPPLEGDYVTFIGSTFVTYGENESSLNHCICLENTTNLEKKNQVIECYENEKEVLLAWTQLIQKEDPDIIIGYNIFGFDYPFMFDRADEHDCIEEFLAFSRYDDGEVKEELEETSIILASGAYDLKYPPMEGRLQIDVFTYMRKEFILPSYKLDYVSSYLISDKVKSFCNYVEEDDETAESCKIETKNMKGITLNCYVHFEIINHSNDLYENGKKFKVIELEDDGFIIEGHLSDELDNETMQWGLAKDDVTPQDIFRMTNEGPNEKGIIAKYCIQDCNLVHQIFQKIDIMTTYIEMSKICSVPISFLMMRGQGIKLTSYIAKKCREMNTLMPLISKGNQWDMYEGAIVLEPKTNLYLDNPVACVDYSSLYPSSIISENISHDSKVWTKTYNLDHELLYQTGERDKSGTFIYDHLPGYKYVDIQYDTFAFKRSSASAAAKKVLTGYKVCRYAQFPNGERAIMPAILQELLAARTATKKQMKKENDPFMKNILDKRQLSIKVTANSLYGQTGAKTSTFYEMDVAASTTATGRKLLHYARDIIENVYNNLKVDTHHGIMMTNAEYIYGDSVAYYTPIYIKVDDQLQIMTIEQIGSTYGNNAWKTCVEPGKQEKEYIDLTPYHIETWTNHDWTPLNTIIRHKLASHKKMVRVLTHTGCVDVTDDHSLLKHNDEEISPNDCEVGEKLMHHPLIHTCEYVASQDEVSSEKARIYGFFFGDGSCGSYSCDSGKKASWALNNKDMDLLNYYLRLCQKVYPEYTWKIYDTFDSSSVYKLAFNCEDYGKKKKVIIEYRDIMYYKKHKIVPSFILNGTNEIKQAFLDGVYDADGNKCDGCRRIDQKSQISCSQLYYLIQSLGYNVSINTRKDKVDIYRLNYSKNTFRKNPHKIKKIMDLPQYTDYVYDLTTTNHHFAAGIGNMIVHNTDSVFFTFNLKDEQGKEVRGQKALEVTIELAKEAGELATTFLKDPHDLEYEKTFMPFCLLSKKRYVGMLYEEDPHKCKRKSMGIVLKRRDNAPIVKDVYGGIIDILMKQQNIQQSISFLDQMLNDIVNQTIPIHKLIISKSLRSFYKNPKQIAHKVLSDRMGVRDPGNKPSPGDRIPYVYILTSKKKDLQGNKIEHPDYIREKKLKIDYGFYITNQIMKPVLQIYSLVLYDMPQFQKRKKMFQRKIARLREEAEDMDKYHKKVQQMKDKEVETILFEKYLILNKNKANNNSMITTFFQPT
jgi:DNA polymerase elongation subunit (family B)